MRNVSLGNHQREPSTNLHGIAYYTRWLYAIAYCSYAVQQVTVQNSTGLKQAEEKMMQFRDMVNTRGLRPLPA